MSQFDITRNIDNSKKIVYDYNIVDINKSDITYNNNYLKIKVSYPVNVPNLSYPDNLNTYNATNIYLSSLIHNNIAQIQSQYIIGELIIEHTAITGTGKLYTCFLLLSDPSYINNEKNDVDKLITAYSNKTNKVSVSLNKTIPQQEYCIIYNSSGTKVLVFTDPIYLNANSYNFITKNLNNSRLTLFPPFNASYLVLKKANITQRGEEEIYIDCTPTGESAEKIASYNVPINSEYTRDWGKLDFMKMTIQLLMVFIFILLAYFGVPIMYKIVVVDNIRVLLRNDEPQDRYIRNIIIDNILLFISAFIFIYTLIYGIAAPNYSYVTYSVYFFIFAGLSLSIILYNKSSLYFKDEYIKIGFEHYQEKMLEYASDLLKDVAMFAMESAIFIGKSFLMSNRTELGKNWGILLGFVMLLFIPLVLFRWGARIINHSTFTFFAFISTFLISVPGTIVYLLCMHRLKIQKEENISL